MSPFAQIRTATQDDARILADIHMDARAKAMPWLAVVHDLSETRLWMAETVLPKQRVRVATVGDTTVGLSAFANGMLEQLYVRPGFQGLGVGSQLFADVCETARAPFRLWVYQRNAPARGFYERRGCRLLRMTDGRDNEERESDVLYEKVIESP
jgi:GNAT superfamily N-acetyltransferase